MAREKNAKWAELVRYKSNDAQSLCSYLVTKSESYIWIPNRFIFRGVVVVTLSISSPKQSEQSKPRKAVSEVTSDSS